MRLLLILSILLVSCNPVKQVLKDVNKFNKVAEEVIRRGYCVNDTIIKTEFKDSVVFKDTAIYLIDSVPCKDFDTIIGRSHISVSSGVLKFETKDSVVYRQKTVVNNIRDRALENILKIDIMKRDSSILDHLKSISDLNKTNEDLTWEARKWKIKFYLACIIGLIVVFRKPIFRMIGI